MEIWKSVVGYEGVYSVSNYGRLRRDNPSKRNEAKGGILENKSTRNRYHMVRLFNSPYGMKIPPKEIAVHSLITRAFLGERIKGYQVNHKDGNKKNNVLSNLEYVTRSDNFIHALEMGLMIPICGENHHKSKLSNKKVKYIRKQALNRNMSAVELANKFGVHKATIHRVIKKSFWKSIN